MALTSSHIHLPLRTPAHRGRLRGFVAAMLWLTSALALLLLAAPFGKAQALSPGGPVDFGSIPVGSTSDTITLNFTANTTTTVGTITAVNDGAANKTFTVVDQSCIGTLSPPASCRIRVAFTPSQLGLRRGQLTLTDGHGTTLNRVPLHGVGLGPQTVFLPVVASATTSLPGLSTAGISPASSLYDGAGTLYVLDVANARVLEQASANTFSQVATVAGVGPRSSMAIGGDGTLYISAPDSALVYSLAPGASQPVVLSTVPVILGRPTGLATDGYGFLYIADSSADKVVRVALDGSGSYAFSPGSLSGPSGMAVDVNHNLFIADTGNNRIVRLSLNTALAAPVAVTGQTLAAPLGLTVDSAGALTVSDTGNRRLVIIPTAGIALALPTPGAALNTPAGITLLPNGDLLVSDTAAGLVTISRSTMGLRFPTSTKVGTTDTADGNLSFSLENTGSYDLQLGGPDANGNAPTSSTGAYSVAPGGTCPTLSTTAAAVVFPRTAVCSYDVSFKPINAGVNNAKLTMSFSAMGGSGSIAPTADLTGTGFAVLSNFSLVATPLQTTPGAPVAVTVTALRNDGSVASDYLGTITLSATDATATFPNGAKTYTFTAADAGVHTFPAITGAGFSFNSVGSFMVAAVDGAINGTSNPVQIVDTPTVILASGTNPTVAGGTAVLTATVTAPVGAPTGTITFFDGPVVLGTAPLAGGTATLTVSFISPGAHTLTAVYSGDANFVTATSPPLTQTVEDFSLALASGAPGSQTVVNNGSTSYALVVAPLGGANFAAPVTFSVIGLPAGFTGTFTPSSVIAGAGSTPVTLQISGGRLSAGLRHPGPSDPYQISVVQSVVPTVLAFAIIPLFFRRRKQLTAMRLALLFVLGVACSSLTGCLSDASSGYYGTIPSTHTLIVTATSGQLSHTVSLTLNVE